MTGVCDMSEKCYSYVKLDHYSHSNAKASQIFQIEYIRHISVLGYEIDIGIYLTSQEPVVQSIVSLTTPLRHQHVKYMLTTLSNRLLFLLKKCENLLQCKRFSYFLNKK